MSASQKLDLKTVYSVTYDARNKWSNILLQLNVSHGTIESINTRYRDSPDDCYRAGLSEWLSGGEREWSDMIRALASPTVGHIDLSKLLEREYLKAKGRQHNVSGVGVEEAHSRGSTAATEQRVNEDLVVFTQENIGNGAFGAVFKGSYREKPCAVKVLHHFVLKMHTNLLISQDGEGAFEALEREGEFLGMFRHPNVVQHISTENNSQWGNTIILVTELMDCNLRSYLSGPGKKTLTVDGEISLCKDVASGLAYIHSKQIIHRDLCGDNILLKYDRGSKVPVAKISDFGMSRMIDPSTLSSTLSSIPNRKGYLPPEATEDNYDQSLDVFSLGVIMMQIVLRLESVQSAKERSWHITQLPAMHELRPLIIMCLLENQKQRPPASFANAALEGGLELPVGPQTLETEDSVPGLEAIDGIPSAKIMLESCAEYKRYPLSEQDCWAITTIKAPTYNDKSRVPVDIVAVIDKSSSMAGEKLRLVKHALYFMIDQLKNTDRLSLITYDSDVYVNFVLLPMNGANKDQARSQVATIREGSCTNLCGGLLKGVQMLGGDREKAQVQAVLLFTDGLANEGIIQSELILAELSKYQQRMVVPATPYQQERPLPSNAYETPPRPPNRIPQNPPPLVPKRKLRWQTDIPPSTPIHHANFQSTIYTFGFGSDHNASLLEAISTQGGGVYYYIDSTNKIAKSLAFCLGGVLSVTAQNMSLKLEIQGGNTVSQVHATGRTVTWTTPEKISCDIGMGDLQSEEERDIVLELKLPAVRSPQQDLVLKASLSYFNVITSALDMVTFDLVVDRKDGDQGPMNMSVDVQKNRIITIEALKRAKLLAEECKPQQARAELGYAVARVAQSPSCRVENIRTQKLMEELQEGVSERMSSHDTNHQRNYLYGMYQRHSGQRSNDPTGHVVLSSPQAYRLAHDVDQPLPKPGQRSNDPIGHVVLSSPQAYAYRLAHDVDRPLPKPPLIVPKHDKK